MTLASALVLSIASSTATLLGPSMFTVSLGVNIIYLRVIKLSNLRDQTLTTTSLIIVFPLISDFNIARAVLVTLKSSRY